MSAPKNLEPLRCETGRPIVTAVTRFPLRSADVEDVARRALSGVAHTRQVVLWTIIVLAVSMLLSAGSHLWDWADVIIDGDAPERDEWLALAGSLWLPVVAGTVYRLVRVHRNLAETA